MITDEIQHIFSSEGPLDKFVVVKNGNRFCFICSSGSDLYVYNIDGSDTSRESWLNAKLIHSFKLDCRIVELLPHENKVFIFLEFGCLWRLESADTCQDDENDIFEMEDSPETVSSWKLEEVCTFPGCATVLSASSSKLGLCVLTRINDTVQVFIVKRKILTSFTLCNGSSGSACCCVLNISNLSFDFMNLWLPHVERSEEFLLVGLSEGSLYCFPLALPLKSYCIYRSVHSIVSLSWFQDRQSQRFDAFVIVLDSGAVVRLTPVGEEVSFPFLPFLNSAVSTKNCVISLAEFETRYLILSDISNKSKPFPVSELTCACLCNESSKMLLVGDTACRVYLLNLDSLDTLNESIRAKKDICDHLPEASDLHRLISSSLQLKKINKTLKIHDEYLRAKSLVSRANILKEHFSISLKLVQVLDDRHTMRLKVCFNLSGVVFSKEFWKLKITVLTMDSSWDCIRDLISNISGEQNLIQLVTIPISFDLMYDFDCQLLAYVESKNVELYFPLGKVEMDACNFLLPPSLKELCSTYEETTDLFWVNKDSNYCLGIALETLPIDIEGFLAQLLSDSKALWRHSEWKKMLKTHVVTCSLFGIDVEFKINENKILIESRNLKACQALRLAFFKKLHIQSMSKYKELFAHCLMGWYQAENIIRLSQNPQGHITDLYNILKNSSLLT